MANIAISGASGRMGLNLIKACAQNEHATLGVAIERDASSAMGKDAGEIAGIAAERVVVVSEFQNQLENFDVLVDFTRPDACLEKLTFCKANQKAMVIGTTGFTDEQKAQISEAAKSIPVVFAPNMGIGVNVTLKLLELAAKAIGSSVDIEIIEAHHKYKVDAPSGTALKMGEVVADAMGKNLDDCAVYAREGITGERETGTIGFSTIRAGDIVGEHTVMFADEGERIEISHKATSRMTFATGAIRAACWAAEQPAGLYDMQDVLGLKD
ncbi:MAG TPA: 4-hydroxy-tetrahydrodipicolinate reductase [Cycloclasticus sp.]|jgi:4-hydroxy-tetrahydrodipicolinate reductase|nr:4-hydroxy-tetrahydrodipicolinate reductase [Cycloclasticus sp.]HIL92585.1 4-hydroxy-tetrahydrodipicolinate reductase [Cycloclasticus sp.]